MESHLGGEYLKRWGFTPQKPIRVAYEQKPEAVKKWLAEEYPAISARAKTEKAEIHWADETAGMNTARRVQKPDPGKDALSVHSFIRFFLLRDPTDRI